jgi:hypothetical protein
MRRILCHLFGHAYKCHRIDQIMGAVFDIEFKCHRCGVSRMITRRPLDPDECVFWMGKSRQLQPPRYFP